MKTIKFSLILLAFMAFAQTTWAQLPCLPAHGETDDQSAWCAETQTIALAQGVNWFSTNLEITMEHLQGALVSALPSSASIKITSRSNGFTRWNGTKWLGGLKTLDVVQMYIITVSEACELTLEGAPINPAEHPINIVNGVNWIGFPFGENMSVTNAFDGFAYNQDKVTSRSNGFARWNGTKWLGGLKNLEPGNGYIYNSAVQTTRVFTYPAATRQSVSSPKAAYPSVQTLKTTGIIIPSVKNKSVKGEVSGSSEKKDVPSLQYRKRTN